MQPEIIRWILPLTLLSLSNCSSPLPYQDDLSFLNSAQADSPEFPISINRSRCRDMDNEPGLCSKRITSADTLTFSIDPEPYVYDLQIECTAPIGRLPAQTVPVNTAASVDLLPSQMQGLKYFICAGEIFPQDRSQPLSAKFDVRVVVSDQAYLPREQIGVTTQNGKPVLVLGEYARSSWVLDSGKWSHYNQTTMVPIQNSSVIEAYSESYEMRFNSFHLVDPVK